MGENIIDDGDLVFTLGDKSGGDETGQLIISDVSLTISRDNDPTHGIGNKEPQGIKYGNKTYELSKESHENEAVADLVAEMYNNDTNPTDAALRSEGGMDAEIGVVVWNEVSKEASDGGDVLLSIDADCREVELFS